MTFQKYYKYMRKGQVMTTGLAGILILFASLEGSYGWVEMTDPASVPENIVRDLFPDYEPQDTTQPEEG
jgi:hypothetical protein